MTDYLTTLLAIGLLAATPAPAVDEPMPATATRYQQPAGAGTLDFSFVQAGARTEGRFRQFTTTLSHDPDNLAASSLEVIVQIGSLDTQDQDRDDTLRSVDLLDAGKFPTARYSATTFAKRGAGLEAIGKLTLHGVTRDLALPLTLRATGSGLEISGEATLKRLDFGVGQGDWRSTEWVGDDITIRFRVPLDRMK